MTLPETLPADFNFKTEENPDTLPADFNFNKSLRQNNTIEQPQKVGWPVPLGGFFDNVLNAPTSLINGIIGHAAEWTGQGLQALGATNIGSKLEQGAEKTLNEGITGYGGEMTGQQPKNAWDVAEKTVETGAEVYTVMNPLASPWAISGLFSLSSGLQSKAEGESTGTAVEKGITTGVLTYFGGKLLGGIAEIAGSALSKVLASSYGKLISNEMGNFVNKISQIGKTNPGLFSNPDVIAEANFTYNSLQKDLWKTIVKEGKIPGADERVQNQAINSASQELTKAFNSKDLTYARMFQRDDIAMPNSVNDLKNTLNVYKNTEAQIFETGKESILPKNFVSKDTLKIRSQILDNEPSGMWKEYLKAVSPIIADGGVPRFGVSLADFLKAELRSKSMGLPDAVQTMVDKTFKQYESDAMSFIKTHGTPQEKTIFNELGQRVDKAEYKYVENVVKSKLTDSFNMYENPSKFFDDVIDSLSGRSITPEQATKFKELFSNNPEIMQNGLFNRLIEKLSNNVQVEAYNTNSKLIDSILQNGGDLFNSEQRNALRYGLKPIATQDFREFMGNFATGKAGKISSEIVSATQEVAKAQNIAKVLGTALKTSDPEILYSGLKSLSSNELETVYSKLNIEGKFEIESFLKVNAFNEINTPIKNNVTGKYNVIGIQKLVNKLQDIRNGLSIETQKELDVLSKILETQGNLENVAVSRFEMILKGVRNLAISKVTGGMGRYQGVIDILKGVFGDFEKISVPEYLSAIENMADQGRILSGTSLINPTMRKTIVEPTLSFSSKMLSGLSYSLSQMMAGHISKGIVSPTDYINRATNIMGRQPTDDEQATLMNQYHANQQQ